MFPALFTLFPTALLSFGFILNPPSPRDSPSATVLCYHTFDSPKITSYTVDLRRFREQLRFIRVQHYPVIPLSQLIQHVRSGTPIPDHAVVITIDDGYKTARTKAFPVLKEFGYPFTIFIYPQFIGRPAALSWQDVKFLHQQGVDIQSHSLTHPLLTHPGQTMEPKEYIEWIDHELIESKRIIEAHLGKPVNALAYPFGGYDERIVDRVRMAGYAAALTCDDGNVSRHTDPLHINRRLVFYHAQPLKFSQYFSERTLQVGELTPRDGQRLYKPAQAVEGRILNIDRVRPDTISIIVDKAGRHPFPLKVDPVTGRFRFPLPAKRGFYFVSLYARDKLDPKLQREASWMFIISKNASKI